MTKKELPNPRLVEPVRRSYQPTKAEQFKENLRVLSITTPQELLKRVLRGDGFTPKKKKNRK